MCSGRKFCSEFFTQLFEHFLCLSKAPLDQSLWSGHHWKDLFLLQKLSIDDSNLIKSDDVRSGRKAKAHHIPKLEGPTICLVFHRILIDTIYMETSLPAEKPEELWGDLQLWHYSKCVGSKYYSPWLANSTSLAALFLLAACSFVTLLT